MIKVHLQRISRKQYNGNCIQSMMANVHHFKSMYAIYSGQWLYVKLS